MSGIDPDFEFAPAKINLALHIRRRREDGYHDLETVFVFADFGDRLHAVPAPDWQLQISGPEADIPGSLTDNLVLRAARAFATTTGIQQCFAFHLHKEIPVAAGLGGGSADAAAALRLLNRLTGDPLPMDELLQMAASLGSDVPACLLSRSLIGEGVGDFLRDGPDVAGLSLLLVNPGVALPVGPVFAAWDGVDLGGLGADWRQGRNDLEAAAIRLQPKIATVLDWLRDLPGVELVRMSGSGASCFAVLNGDHPLPDAPSGWWWRAVRLI